MDDVIRCLKRLAAEGNVEAQYLLGRCYQDGFLVRRNRKAGFELLLKAAKAGHKSAPFQVATCYVDADGVEADPVAARDGFSRRPSKEFPKLNSI